MRESQLTLWCSHRDLTLGFGLEFILLPFVVVSLLLTVQCDDLNGSRPGGGWASSALLPRFETLVFGE
jgi:hypothetical protein